MKRSRRLIRSTILVLLAAMVVYVVLARLV